MRRQPVWRLLLLILIASNCLLVGLAAVTRAANVSISGADATVYDHVTGSFVFQGNITITSGDTTITGQYVVYDGTNSRLDIRGPMTITYDGTTLEGRDLSYQIDTEDGSLKEASTSLTPNGAISPVYLLGEEVTTCSVRTVLTGAKLTTCDPQNPGYYLAAKTIEIYPEDRIVLRHVRFVESGLTLFYWPWLAFSLKGTDLLDQFDKINLPQIGHSAAEGWYIKSTFKYRGPGTQQGQLHLDYMQYLGWGAGISHELRNDTKGSDRLYLYAQPNRKTGHTDVSFSFDEQRVYGENINVGLHSAFTSSQVQLGERRHFTNRLSLAQSRATGSTAISYSDQRYVGVNPGFDIVGSANHTQTLPGDWRLRLNGTLHQRELINTQDRNLIGYVAEITKNTADWSVGLVAEDRFHPDLADDEKKVVETAWSRAQRLPELTLRINRLKLFGWETPLTFDTAWGMLTENRKGTTGMSTERIHLAARLKQQRLNLRFLGELTGSGALIRRWYGTGESQWVLNTQANYRLPVTQGLTLTSDYSYEQAFGETTPFYFDRVNYREQVTARLNYQSSLLQLSASTGYNLANKSFMDVVGSVRLSPSNKLRIQAQTAYSLQQNQWDYVVGTVQIAPNSFFNFNFGGKYSIRLQRTERVDAQLFWDLGGWELGYTGIYDGVKNKFERGDFVITRDLDCRAIDLRYNQVKQEVWLEYRITAFPTTSVKLGASETNLMFDARGWEELLPTE